MLYLYQPRGVCAREIEIDMDQDVIRGVRFFGGCSGNLQGIGALVKGMPAQEAVTRLKGIHCGMKPTSCPDQLARGLEKILADSGR